METENGPEQRLNRLKSLAARMKESQSKTPAIMERLLAILATQESDLLKIFAADSEEFEALDMGIKIESGLSTRIRELSDELSELSIKINRSVANLDMDAYVKNGDGSESVDEIEETLKRGEQIIRAIDMLVASFNKGNLS